MAVGYLSNSGFPWKRRAHNLKSQASASERGRALVESTVNKNAFGARAKRKKKRVSCLLGSKRALAATVLTTKTLEAKERNNSNSMSNPVVVQGTPVQNPNSGGGFASALGSGSAPAYTSSAPPPPSNDREGKKESSCNDPIFAVLFYVALVAICAVAGIYGPDAIKTGEDTANNQNPIEYEGYLILTGIIACISFLGAAAGMALLFWIPQFLIKTALIFTVIMCKSFVLLEDAPTLCVAGQHPAGCFHVLWHSPFFRFLRSR